MATALVHQNVLVFHDHDQCYQAIQSRDARFDGYFVTAVRTTGIYCRPSCPARTPLRSNVEFFSTGGAAQQHGYRACKRCRPELAPDSPEWNLRSDLVGRAMRLISEGEVDRGGVGPLAARLGYSSRQLQRVVRSELGASPAVLARARRAQAARVLIDQSDLPFTQVAFASGFSSVRQFNDAIQGAFAASPTALRAQAIAPLGGRSSVAQHPEWVCLELRLEIREPFSGAKLLEYLRARAIEGVEEVQDNTYTRLLRLDSGCSWLSLDLSSTPVGLTVELENSRDLPQLMARCRALLGADADPCSGDEYLAKSRALKAMIAANPGLRSPGCLDPHELAIRAVLGQQITVAAAAIAAGRLVAAVGRSGSGSEFERRGSGLSGARVGGTKHQMVTFPTAAEVAGVDPALLPLPSARARCVVELAETLATGQISLHAGADRELVYNQLKALRGIGPWTAGYIVLRALQDPDRWIEGDAALAAAGRGLGMTPAELSSKSSEWAPWRSLAMQHLWQSSVTPPNERSET